MFKYNYDWMRNGARNHIHSMKYVEVVKASSAANLR